MISEKIVVVDDDKRIIEALKVCLFEYELISFNDPRKAIDYLAKPNMINLVILDVCMKGLNGIEVLEIIKKQQPQMAVMMLTGYATSDIIIEALRGKADDFIEKPFDAKVLKERIKKILKERSKFNPDTRDHQVQAERIRQFIERNYSTASLNFVADELCLSPKYVSRFFASNSQENFRAYKLKIKMQKACQLLKGSSLNVSEIAIELGYSNPESFMRAFKAHFQKTPLEFRQSERKEISYEPKSIDH